MSGPPSTQPPLSPSMSRIKHNAMMDTFKRDDPNHDRDEDEDKVREIPYTLFKLGIVRKFRKAIMGSTSVTVSRDKAEIDQR